MNPYVDATHAPQTCLSTSSSTLALNLSRLNRLSLSDKIYYSRGIPLCQQNFRKNLRNFRTLKIIFKTGENRHFSALCLRLLAACKKLPPFGKFRQPAEIFYFFAEMLRKHLMHSAPPIPPYGAGAEIWAVGFHLLRQATIKYFRGCRPAGSHGGSRVPPALC